jgi:hypothetical protein
MQVRLLMTTVLLLEFALFGIAYHFHGVIDSGSRRVIHDSCWWFLVGRPTDHPIRQLKKTNQNKIKIKLSISCLGTTFNSSTFEKGEFHVKVSIHNEFHLFYYFRFSLILFYFTLIGGRGSHGREKPLTAGGRIV